MPFAGHQHSGYGTGGMRYTMEDMAEEKLVVMKLG
jgi:acyl-CoA reductase-like NAD-dependent aldehyde dehydrogenase